MTTLVSLLGSVHEVFGFWDTLEPVRRHYSLARTDCGQEYRYESENLVSAILRFSSGAHGVLHFNANSIQNEKPQMILYGTEGLMFLPDPNQFGGDVRILLKGQSEPLVLPATHAFTDNARGLGAADMAWALMQERPPRTNSAFALHVLETLLGIQKSQQTGSPYRLTSSSARPRPLPRGFLDRHYSNADPENGLAWRG